MHERLLLGPKQKGKIDPEPPSGQAARRAYDAGSGRSARIAAPISLKVSPSASLSRF
jgi:hypothetical protein